MPSRWRLWSAAAGTALAVAALTAGCTSSGQSGPTSTGKPIKGGVVSMAELPQSPPNYIFPFVAPAYNTVQNVGQFQQLMYRPLYWLSNGNSLAVDESLSVADKPVWNSAHDQVEIKLKDYSWSDGSKLTPRSVAFWIGLSRAEKANDAHYTPGQFPDNVKSAAYDDKAGTVTLTLTSAVSPDWFQYNQLADITPLPLAWDRTSGSSSEAGCSSEDAAVQAQSCAKVYDYLNGKAKQASSYASDPLWQIVDGPFKLKSFSTDGNFSLVPNSTYSGAPKPSLAQINFVPFTSETAEYNAFRSGRSLGIGYVPLEVLKAKTPSAKPGPSPVPGYTLDPDLPWGFSYLLINFHNPTVGPMLRQLYIRQALQTLVDQNVYIEKAGNGYGTATFGPVPLQPASPFTKGMVSTNPYAFSVDAAKKLLTSHGWSIPGSGTATCQGPGTGTDECGAGIAAGQKLSLKLESYSGQASTVEMMSQYSSDASHAGIDLQVNTVAPQQMVADAAQCKPTQASCSWQLINYGSAVLTPYPTGSSLFQSGAGGNVGNYSDPRMDSLIDATLTSSDPSAIAKYATYAAQQVPVIWQPTMATPVYSVMNSLKGAAPISPLYNLTPEKWYLTK